MIAQPKELNIKDNSPEPLLSFYNKTEGRCQSHIWEELSNGLWRTFSLDAYLYNNLLPSLHLEKSKPLFKNIQQIEAGTEWDYSSQSLKQTYYTPHRTESTLSNLLSQTEKYIDSLKCHRIGVHLSGGFDSCLIMCLLRELNIPFVPIGLMSDTFEFRTERHIQELMLEYGNDGLLINMNDYPHYSALESIPAHQIPDADIKSNAGSNALAEAFRDRGCDIVFSGQGADTLFMNKIESVETTKLNIGNEFLIPTEVHRIYKPRGIKLESFYARPEIIDVICSAREGQKDDYRKLWARDWTKSIIPRELSEWAYTADFFALSMWGLGRAKPTIKLLIEETNDLFGTEFFSKEYTTKFMAQDILSFEYTDYIKFCSIISVASWIHSLFNNG